MKHFLNKELLAANMMTVSVDPAIVAEFGRNDDWHGFESVFPKWKSDIEWLSPATTEMHAIFESAFQRLGIADYVREYLDIEREVRLYAGFLVIRSECSEASFHVDWLNTGNEAFTLLTPVSANAEGFGLLYKKLTGDLGEYDYKIGEAIVFGDNFHHSTKPGRSEKPVVLLCFEFGTDKMEHWDKIYATIGKQAGMLRKPNGEFMRTDAREHSGY
jgi:hypothetical protein